MADTNYTIRVCFFDDLTPKELYRIIRLRNEVFVVEQNCVFQDADNKDQFCHHLMVYAGDELVAYARLVPPGVSYKEMSIGRVVSSPAYRKTGAGRFMMQQAIEECHRLFGEGPIRIGAQLYLQRFYESLGFIAEGDIYLEDDIQHIEMVRP
jgi:ElaA protein